MVRLKHRISLCRAIPSELIIAAKGWGLGYFPVAVKLSNDEVAAVIRGGGEHVGPEGRLEFIKSRDRGRTWSTPYKIFDSPSDDRNPAMGQARNGTIFVAFAKLEGYYKGYLAPRKEESAHYHFKVLRPATVYISSLASTECFVMRSEDNGATWSNPKKLEFPRGNSSPYGKIITLRDGTLLLPIYEGSSARGRKGSRSYVLRSRDNGESWGDPSLISSGFNETALLDLVDGKIIAALRHFPTNALYTNFSLDGGYSWTIPKKVTDDHEHPADFIQLGDGALMMLYGHRKYPFGVQGMISLDGGKNWDRKSIIMFSGDAIDFDCGYPSAVRFKDGTIVILYYQVGSHVVQQLHSFTACIRVAEEEIMREYRRLTRA